MNEVKLFREGASHYNGAMNMNMRKFISDWPLIHKRKGSSPYRLAVKYIKYSSGDISASEVNSVLACFNEPNISITQSLLDEILRRPRIDFINLDESTINSDKFLNNIGTVRKEVCPAGVYIWTHVSTGSKYVGSSSTLARRLIGYFKGTHGDTGKFIPMLKKEGVGAFDLQVIPLIEKYHENQEFIIEQFFAPWI